MTASPPLLSLNNVSKTFAGRGRRRPVAALDGVTITVARGEAVGIVGASGAGKTTIARLVAGLEQPDSGTITLDGNDLGRLDPSTRKSTRRAIHLVFQDPYSSLSPTMRIGDIVAEPLDIHRDTTNRTARIIESLTRVHLDPPERFADRRAHELSGGERQRVALARAVIARPKLIIADEPTAMLDASLRVGLLDLLRELRRTDGVAFLYITHDLAVAQSFCDRLAVMANGRIVEQGLTADVLEHAHHPATIRLVDAASQLTLDPQRSQPAAHP